MAFNCINNTGRALTLIDGANTVIVIASGQAGNNIQLLITNVKLGGSTTVYGRLQGAFVDGATYTATFGPNVTFASATAPNVVYG